MCIFGGGWTVSARLRNLRWNSSILDGDICQEGIFRIEGKGTSHMEAQTLLCHMRIEPTCTMYPFLCLNIVNICKVSICDFLLGALSLAVVRMYSLSHRKRGPYSTFYVVNQSN